MSIKIHEFSTGIKPVGDRDNWHSLGFAGQYMNKTLEEIPRAVQAAISNRWFAVAEGGATESPALIGREVEDEQGAWSVLAVVTRGRDEDQRPFSASRYFLCEGKGNVEKILRYWWKIEPRLVFNPFDDRKLSDFPNDHEAKKISLLTFEEMLKGNIPIIYSLSKIEIPPLSINAIAEKKAQELGQLVAWAYKVEALEAPRSFQVIYPASREAEDLLNRVIASQPNIKNAVQEEQAIKKAIGLLIQNRIKPEHLQIIEQGLGNSLIDFKYWQAMFDSQGATDAIKQGNYSPQTVRLLTLRAMVLPETLPQFLDWLLKRSKQTEHYDISSEFQSAIIRLNLKDCKRLSDKIYQGVLLIILALRNDPYLLDSVVWLLQSSSYSCWMNAYGKFKKDLDQAFKTNGRDSILLQSKDWETILNYWRNENGNEDYLILAKLFERLEDYKIASVFYYLSFEKIPKSVANRLKNYDSQNYYGYIKIYGREIQRELSTVEYIYLVLLQIGNYDMKPIIFIPVLITTVGISLGVGYYGASNFAKPRPYTNSLNILAQEILQQDYLKNLEKLKKISEPEKQVVESLQIVLNSRSPSDIKDLKALSCYVAQQIDLKEKCTGLESQYREAESIQSNDQSNDLGNRGKKGFFHSLGCLLKKTFKGDDSSCPE